MSKYSLWANSAALISRLRLIASLRSDVKSYASQNGGRIYSPIEHFAFRRFAYHHGGDRWALISRNLPDHAVTALDVGAHWGYFSWNLERMGIQVVASESSPTNLRILHKVRSLHGANFDIVGGDILARTFDQQFDVTLALNIFHHFLKSEDRHAALKSFLQGLDTACILFQAHSPREGQMRDAYRNYGPKEFALRVAEWSGLESVVCIARFGERPLFKISRSENLS